MYVCKFTLPLIYSRIFRTYTYYFSYIVQTCFLNLWYAFYSPSQLYMSEYHTHSLHTPPSLPIVSAFSYYQFYCFQNTEDIFNRFDSEEESLTDFLNSTENLSNRLCVQTQVFRSFISSQLPWFRYQKETWLAIGGHSLVFLLLRVVYVHAYNMCACVCVRVIES